MKLWLLLILGLNWTFSFGQEIPVVLVPTITQSDVWFWLPPCGEQFHENGRLLSKCECVNDTMHGKYTQWTENGMKWKEQTYTMGTLKKSVDWYEDGKIESIFHYHDIDHCYKKVLWSSSGEKQEITHFDWEGEFHGLRLTYFGNGHLEEEQRFVHGDRSGLHKKYNKDLRELVIENRLNNQRHGNYEKWYDKVLIEQGQYENGKKEGVWNIIDPENPTTRLEVQYHNDQIFSESKFEDDNLKNSMDFISGKFVEYDLNKVKRKEWLFINLKRNGLQLDWNEQGKLTGRYYLDGGRFCDSSRFYNSDGTVRIIDWVTFDSHRAKRIRHKPDKIYTNEYLINNNGDTLEQRVILNSVDNYEIIASNSYENNQKSGIWKLVDLKSGVVTSQLTYLNGVLDGAFTNSWDFVTNYGRNGRPEKRAYHDIGTYKNNLLDGEWIRSYDIDSITIIMERAQYKNGMREGLRIKYVNEHMTEHYNYHLGKLHGSCIILWSNEDTIQTGNYEMGLKQGKWQRYADDSLRKYSCSGQGDSYQGQYNLGVPVGHWKYFGTFGHLESEGDYVNGQEGGHWIFYYSGKDFDKNHSIKSSEGTLIGKEKVGVWKFYKRNGRRDYKWDFNKFPERN